MTELRISVRNTSEAGGTFLTPVYFGFHDGSFDLFEAGQEASAGLEQLAVDGDSTGLAAERQAADADSQGLVVTGAAGPVATQEFTSARFDVDGASNGQVSFAAMVLPSNDAFIGNDDALALFDANGRFQGAQTVELGGADVYDAGTEVNTEEDAAFLNQAAPNTGVDENGVVTQHPGFNGSEGNPVGEGNQNIIGGTNALGEAITEAADFTRAGAEVATIHINTVVDRTGTDRRDFIWGGRDDDIVDAKGGSDFIKTGRGWDVIDAGDGRDFVSAGRGDDIVDGGAGRDTIFAGRGNDIVEGGTGRDSLWGGRGDDMFVFSVGSGRDVIWDFDRRGEDKIVLSFDGVESLQDVLDAADQGRFGTKLDFGADEIFLRGVAVTDLGAEDFAFG